MSPLDVEEEGELDYGDDLLGEEFGEEELGEDEFDLDEEGEEEVDQI